MPNPTPFKPVRPDREKIILNTWLALVIVVVVALFAVLIIYKFYQSSNNQNFVPLPDSESEKEMPAEIHSYTGTITKINDNTLTITASANRNYLTNDQEFTVNLSEKTQIIALTIPKQLTGNPTKDKVQREPATTKELAVGQNIFVMSIENIADKTTFTADKIEIQIVK